MAAIDAGKFVDEIVPVIIPQKKKDPIVFAVDEYPKRNTDMQQLARKLWTKRMKQKGIRLSDDGDFEAASDDDEAKSG